MKPSHTQTPRTLAECNFTDHYIATKPSSWETVAGYLLAFSIGVALASILFIGWSN